MNEINQKNSVEELLAELFTESTDGDNKIVTNNTFPNDVITLLATNDVENIQNLTDEEFHQLFRMNKENVQNIQDGINEENDSNLLLTLFILGNTIPLPELALVLNTNEKKLITICNNIFEKILKLSDKYITWPNPSEMLTLENLFIANYDFPSVIGAIGCLHIATQIPETIPDVSSYYNEDTGYYTIVLQAVCDSNLLFRDLFIGYPGSYSVEEILQASPLYNKLVDDNSLLKKLNKHLLGGTEHPQLNTLLTPYPLINNVKLSDKQLRFNSRHSAAMSVIDKTFRIIENRFQRMKGLEYFDVKFVTLAMGAICVLHNFTRIKKDYL